MFQTATLKLTGLYLGILLLICSFFSLNLYNLSTQELTDNFRRQAAFLQDPRFINDPIANQFLQQRESAVSEAQERIIIRLLEVNIVIILLGGIGSYFLARRTLQPIQASHESQSRFTADASHELRTPLAAMQTEIEVALRDPILTKEEAKTLLKSNLEELAKLTSLSEGLLQLARPAEKVKKQSLYLYEIVVQAIERAALPAKQKKIAIISAIPEAIQLVGEPNSLTQLVAILLDNAIKYSQTGQDITIKATESNRQIAIKVIDQGSGISSADLPHIFDRFYQADSSRSKEKQKGYGLGLSIAKRITDLHHGSIQAVSTVGQGSTFTILLPKQQKLSSF